MIGTWLAASGKRDKVLIATKFGADMGEDMKGLSARWMRQAVESSLQRLRTDRIDLYQSHMDDLATPQEETAEAFSRLVSEGKVRAIGASNFDAGRLKSANAIAESHGWPRYEALQPLYNLYDRAPFEAALAAECAAEGIGVIPYYGLASGFLTGKYRSEADLSKSPRGRGAKRFLGPRGMRILSGLNSVAARLGATPAQVALAWLMAKVTAPIASATSVAQLKELLAAARLRLDEQALASLDAASAPEPAEMATA